MNRKLFTTLIFTCSLLTLLNSCMKCSCTCDRNLGCKIVTVERKSNHSVIMTKVFCSQTLTNYGTDNVLKDSVNSFFLRYTTDSTIVTATDSIYKYESVNRRTCKERKAYESEGFGCECVK